ncbi:MAG: transposase [Promethearchaeota archaeon]
MNFNFSVFSTEKSKREVERPKFPDDALFKALILKNLALNSSFRTLEAMISQDPELAEFLGFNGFKVPIDSVLRSFFAAIKLTDIQAIHNHFLKEL